MMNAQGLDGPGATEGILRTTAIETKSAGRRADDAWMERQRPNRARQLVRRALAVALPSRLYLTHGSRRSRTVYLTFDDGPDPILTPRLLDVLWDCGIRATFFLIGEKVERHPDIVRRIAADGHCIGNHSFHHSDPGSTSAAQLLLEVRRTSRILAALVDRPVTLFRPPHGKVTLSKLLRVWRARQTVVLWNVDPKDHTLSSLEELQRRFREQLLRGGDVVLMHDSVPHSVEVIPYLAEAAREAGLTYATVSDFIV